MKKLILLFPLFLIWGCSSQNKNQIPKKIRKLKNLTVIPTNAKPVDKISFDPVATIRDTDNIFINIHDAVGVDGRGRIYIDGRNTINVFSPNGHYITHFGRRGRGPGEYENMLKMAVQSERLYIYDNSTSRIDIFTLNPPSFSHAIIISPDKWNKYNKLKQLRLDNFFVRNDGSFLFEFNKPGIDMKYKHYYLADSTGKVISKQIFKRRYVDITNGTGGGQGIPTPFQLSKPPLPSSRSSLMAVSTDGHIFSDWSQNFLIKEYNPKGKYIQAIYHPYKNAPVHTQQFVKNYLKRFKRHLAKLRNGVNNELQKTWPALSYLLVDSQKQLWVATITKDSNNYEWWVISPSGKLLSKFKWPGKRMKRDFAPRHIRVIKNGFLYAFKSDTAKKTAELVKYKIVLKPH